MTREDFEEAVERVTTWLRSHCHQGAWEHLNEVKFDHGRLIELSVWRGKGKEDEVGHVFRMSAATWDGDIPHNWMLAILNGDQGIRYNQVTKVWDLSRFANQTEPVERCPNCAHVGQWAGDLSRLYP